MINDFEWCETDPVFERGLCFYVFSKKGRVIPTSEWRGIQSSRVSLSKDHAFQLLRDLRNVCFEKKIKCEALEKLEEKLK